ncbi:Rrf2 family transcriptional regulator [Paenibacillus sp. KQZ6P-2]|uniref:Rrf2 family transcriptional regulator n=1 Tax=Paenibacillus mangrovi TaxID=2931978 RepID=A0A9X1WSF5_9BACL|nr:Rrf2 family transcriptional regulator [Paenibacillus mangrovi]MCJ8014229.1 Rrf2 family transcriptional regulator [Paenibacillus mangrovi]
MNPRLGSLRYRTTQSVILLLGEHGGILNSAQMAREIRIHAVYLRKIISPLLVSGLVEAKEGRDGGYKLACLRKYKVADLIVVVMKVFRFVY